MVYDYRFWDVWSAQYPVSTSDPVETSESTSFSRLHLDLSHSGCKCSLSPSTERSDDIHLVRNRAGGPPFS